MWSLKKKKKDLILLGRKADASRAQQLRNLSKLSKPEPKGQCPRWLGPLTGASPVRSIILKASMPQHHSAPKRRKSHFSTMTHSRGFQRTLH